MARYASGTATENSAISGIRTQLTPQNLIAGMQFNQFNQFDLTTHLTNQATDAHVNNFKGQFEPFRNVSSFQHLFIT